MTLQHAKPSTARVEIPGRAARSGGGIGLGDAVPGWRDEEGRDARHDREAASWKDGDADIERSRGQGGAHPDAETRARVRGTRGGARQGGDPGRPRGRDPGFAASPRRRRRDARGGGPETPKPDPAELAAELHETARREARAKSEEALAAERRRRLEQRQRAIREAVPAKHENIREFHAFASMMKRWRYWDQDYARLHEMHHRHLRQLDEADARAPARGS